MRFLGFALFIASIISCGTPFAGEEQMSAPATIGFVVFGIMLLFVSTLLIGMTQYNADSREMAKRMRDVEEERERQYRELRKNMEREERERGRGSSDRWSGLP